jgi:hypothetical protein
MQKKTLRTFYAILFLIFAALACSMPGAAPAAAPSAPPVDLTKVALEYQATSNAAAASQVVDATKVALEILATNNAPAPAQPVDATKIALEIQATNAAAQLTRQAEQQASLPQPTTEATTSVLPVASPAPDLDARIKNAKILVYEDTQDIGLWISEALNGMGLKYTHVGDAIGDFMQNLNSPVQWDLIIVGAESKSKVQGEFWDVIAEKLSRDHTALIAEVWYLDSLGSGRIKTVTSNCGIQFQKDWPLAESIYWLDSNHPLFSDPNDAMPLINYSRYWNFQAGDLIKIAPGSNATLLGGVFQKRKSDYGVLATCYEGRVVFQTFSNHDFHYDDIIALWQNYITYVLKNRFTQFP